MDFTQYEFLEICKDITSKYFKIPKKEYLAEGTYAIIDQGKAIFSGYTNNQKLINFDNEEVVIFGDHTRILKFIDIPIAIGADGVKVLEIDKERADPRFIYYYLKSLKIQDAGYSRHYKFLKRKTLTIPKSITDQKQIAKVLSDCKQLIQWRKESIQLLDDYLESTFLEMFGKSKNKSWAIKKLGDLAEARSGVTKGKKYKDQELKEVPYLRVANAQDGYLDLTEIKKIVVSEKDVKKYLLRKGDLLLTEGGDPDKLGRGAIYNESIKNCIYQNHLFRVRPTSDQIDIIYLSSLISSSYGKKYFLKAAKQTTGIATINSTQLRNFPVIIPPIGLQWKYSKIRNRVKSCLNLFQVNLMELENLFGSISQKAFRGELNLNQVQIKEVEEIEIKNITIKGDNNQLSEKIAKKPKTSNAPTTKKKNDQIEDATDLSVKELFLSGRSAEVNWTNSLGRKDFNLDDDPLNYLYAIYYTFKEREFSFQEIEMKTAASLMLSTNIDYEWKPEEWKKKIFQYLTSKPPYLVQAFNKQEGRIKLKVNYEALTI